VEELGLGFVRMAGNLSLDLIEAWAINMDSFEGSMIFGSKGGIRLEPFGYFSSECDVDLNAGADLKSFLRRKELMQPEIEVAWLSAQHHWIAGLLGKVEHLPSAELALNTMLITQGIYLSEQLGREVTVEEVKELTKSSAIKI
jgi:predicted dehydrogenase